jgi:hypothetical protein
MLKAVSGIMNRPSKFNYRLGGKKARYGLEMGSFQNLDKFPVIAVIGSVWNIEKLPFTKIKWPGVWTRP